jgi:protein FRG1
VRLTSPSHPAIAGFVPLTLTSLSVPIISTGGTFPSFALRTQSEKFLSAAPSTGASLSKDRIELRADADELGEHEMLRVKCQREFVFKAKVAKAEAMEGKGKSKLFSGGPAEGSLEDEMRRK